MDEIVKITYRERIQYDIEEAINDMMMIVVFDYHGNIQYVNDKFTEVTNYAKEEMLGNSFGNFFTSEISENLTHTIEDEKKWAGELKQKKKDGTYYWSDITISPIMNKITGDNPYVLLQREITERKEHEQMIEKLAYVDPLTSLPNRNQITRWINDCHHAADKEITVFFIDIDRFKIINDNFGHDVGDQVLITISERLKACIQDKDFIFRYDGEEFILLLENQSMEDINNKLNQLLAAIRKPICVDNLELLVTASIGISRGFPFSGDEEIPSIENLIKKADTAMYHAKKQGRNQFHFHTDNQERELERTYQIELEIREALERNEFSLVYQPLINLRTNKIVGVESLLRWDNRLLGRISPAEFIPILEETGLIIPVGKWILQSVSIQMKSWQEQGLFLQRVSVNVSPIQFQDPYFVADLKKILHKAEVDPSYLELEITEGTLLDIDDSAKKLHDLQDLGVKVSIDDFGTGYSSLSYLKQLPIDTLKIDKSFIDDLDRDGKIIVNTIISMGKNLQFRVIAEGIENSDQFKYLKQQQCHEGQGYFFSRPVESDKIEELYYSLQ